MTADVVSGPHHLSLLRHNEKADVSSPDSNDWAGRKNLCVALMSDDMARPNA